jgi:hypothetical protein
VREYYKKTYAGHMKHMGWLWVENPWFKGNVTVMLLFHGN